MFSQSCARLWASGAVISADNRGKSARTGAGPAAGMVLAAFVAVIQARASASLA